METIILVLLMGGMNLIAFLIGARTTQKAYKGEEIKLPSINPMETYRKVMEQQEAKEKQEELETNMYNINNYIGDETGQKNFK